VTICDAVNVLVSVASGLGNCIAPIFLSEIAPFNYRGAFGTLHQLFVTLGILLASIFGIPQLLGLSFLTNTLSVTRTNVAHWLTGHIAQIATCTESIILSLSSRFARQISQHHVISSVVVTYTCFSYTHTHTMYLMVSQTLTDLTPCKRSCKHRHHTTLQQSIAPEILIRDSVDQMPCTILLSTCVLEPHSSPETSSPWSRSW